MDVIEIRHHCKIRSGQGKCHRPLKNNYICVSKFPCHEAGDITNVRRNDDKHGVS